jgi:SulP family sulfate permease
MSHLFEFKPKLLEALQGYTRQRCAQDIGAGLAVGVVALPLAIAFAVASGLTPETGLITSIIAGFLIAALGGSRVQIGGPAGAFIVIVYGIVDRYGVANLIIATAMSGVMLFAMGLFKLGTLVRFIPVAVVTGFTNGIAVLIVLSQVKEFLGLDIPNMPANFFGILRALRDALHTFNPYATMLALCCLLVMVLWQGTIKRLSPGRLWAAQLALVPGSIVALVLATVAVAVWDLPVETIGSRFGGMPSELPGWVWPDFSWSTVRFLLIPAMTLALLGAIESLLCARVADSLIDDRHNPNQELMAQGIANFITPFFGGMPATGTIARTVTNAQSGATSPVAGMVHALTLLIFMWVAAPLAKDIPLAAMAAILMYMAWNMGEWRAFIDLRHFRLPYRATLLAVFLLTVIFDLTVAVEVGLVAACMTFIYRISSLTRCETVQPATHPGLQGQEGRIAAYRLHGALFFGAVQLIEKIEDALPSRALVLDLSHVLYIDSSGADTLNDLIRSGRKHGVAIIMCGVAHQPRDILQRCGLLQALPHGHLCATLDQALELAVHGIT